MWQALPAREPAWILGDFNSRIGINTAAAPSPAAEGVHGPCGLGQLNTNGERFLYLCSEAHLKVLSTFFQHSADELTSWVHRRWGMQAMIDYAVGRATDWCYVLDTHSLPHAEVNSDHRLMVLKLRAAPGRYVRAAPIATCDKDCLVCVLPSFRRGTPPPSTSRKWSAFDRAQLKVFLRCLTTCIRLGFPF